MKFRKLSVISFEQWLANNPEIAAEATMEDCPDCHGEGETQCFECGRTKECDTCGGRGQVNSARRLYQEAVSRDHHQMKAHIAPDGRVYAFSVCGEVQSNG